jgi:hypothetical protein
VVVAAFFDGVGGMLGECRHFLSDIVLQPSVVDQ